MRVLFVFVIIAVAIVVMVKRTQWRHDQERMRRAQEMSLLLQEPTENPDQCEHQWLEYIRGDCYSDYEGQNQWSTPNACESYVIYMCPKCHATSYTCSKRNSYYRVLTGPDACVGCEYTPNSPDHLRADQPSR